MNTKSRIAELTSLVASQTSIVDTYLAEQRNGALSFAEDGLRDLHLPSDIEQARQVAIDAGTELTDLLKGPRDLLFDHHHNQQVYLKFISEFKVAENVPTNGEIGFDDLASVIGVSESIVTRIMRMAIANRIFSEPQAGRLAHTAASRLLADDPNMRDWLGASVDELWPSGFYLLDALKKWPNAAKPSETGFSLAFQSSRSFYEELDSDPERARRFGGAMSFYTTGDGYSLRHLTDNFPWQSVNRVVDLGGSLGDSGFAISERYPDTEVIVQDLPKTIAAAKERPGFKVKFMAQDFLQPQPDLDADVYLLRWILHNWSDDYAVKILQSLVPGLKSGVKVLVMDNIIPPPNTLPNSVERRLRAMDVTMLEIANAKERSLEEWDALFKTADKRFILGTVKQPQGSRLGLLEYTWTP